MGISAIFVGLVAACWLRRAGRLASHFGWRITFLLAGVPGWCWRPQSHFGLREVRPVTAAAAPRPPSRPLEILRVRNVTLCAIIASLLLGCAAIVMISCRSISSRTAGSAPSIWVW